MKQTPVKILLMGAALVVFVAGWASRAHANPQAPAQTSVEDIPPSEFSQWDSASEVFNREGKSMTTVTIKNGKLDFSRPPGEGRRSFLKSLGLNQVYTSVLGMVPVNSQGRVGLTAVGVNGVFQALKEEEDGFNLVNGVGSEILDREGNRLATVVTEDGKPSLALAPGQSLDSLHQAGLRFFYYKIQKIGGKPKSRGVKLVKDEGGNFTLE